jgi:glycerate 2-kinase
MEKYRITEPFSAIKHLMRAADETPKQGDPRLANTSTATIATPQLSLEAAADVARQAGVTPLILGDALEGEAREVGRVMAGIARQASALAACKLTTSSNFVACRISRSAGYYK